MAEGITAVFGSPTNTDHGRKCGCKMKFREPVRTRLEETGYDVYSCAMHDTAPRLRDALAALVAACADVLDVGPAYDDAIRALKEAEAPA